MEEKEDRRRGEREVSGREGWRGQRSSTRKESAHLKSNNRPKNLKPEKNKKQLSLWITDQILSCTWMWDVHNLFLATGEEGGT